MEDSSCGEWDDRCPTLCHREKKRGVYLFFIRTRAGRHARRWIVRRFPGLQNVSPHGARTGESRAVHVRIWIALTSMASCTGAAAAGRSRRRRRRPNAYNVMGLQVPSRFWITRIYVSGDRRIRATDDDVWNVGVWLLYLFLRSENGGTWSKREASRLECWERSGACDVYLPPAFCCLCATGVWEPSREWDHRAFRQDLQCILL
jgi:hypothetical protein